MSESISQLEAGDKVEIFGDYFKVDSNRRIKGRRLIKLWTNDPEIIGAYIDFFSDNDSVFHITRKIKTKINRKNILYDKEIYQIIKEYYETKVTHEGILRDKVYEVKKNKEKVDPKNIRKIILHSSGDIVFYNFKKIESKDVILNPSEKFDDSFEKGSTRVTFKFKEKP